MTGGGTSLSDEVSVADVPRTIVATFSLSNDRVSVSTPNGPRGISVHSHVVLWKISFSILVMIIWIVMVLDTICSTLLCDARF